MTPYDAGLSVVLDGHGRSEKMCSKCKLLKPMSDYPRRPNRKSKFQSYCKNCDKKIKALCVLKKPELYKEIDRKKYLRNKKTMIAAANTRNIARRKKDILFRLTHNLRTRLSKIVSGKYKETSAIKDLGCTVLEFKIHLEKQFSNNMSWDNYGINGWHIDHIIPLTAAKTQEELKQLNYYTNLQPLWATDNIRKGGIRGTTLR